MKRKPRTAMCIVMPALVGSFAAQAWGAMPQPATDEQIQTMIADAGKSEDYDKADLVYVLDETDVFVQKTGLAT